MKKPQMIIFDAGRTLIDYVSVDTLRGVRALMPYITSNPRGLTAEEIDSYTNRVFEHFEQARKQLFEVHEQTILKLVYGLLDLQFSIPLEEIERTVWLEDSVVEPIEQTREVVTKLNELGIRTAVISNLDFSGYLLKERLDDLFPDNRFEFVVASSGYGVRKPTAHLFEVGIAKSGLHPDEIWYVGDKVKVDVAGSQNSGMTPVLYKNKRNTYDTIPEGILVMDEFSQLLDLLAKCE